MYKLSDSEWKVLEALWQADSLLLGDIVDSLYRRTKWSRNTVHTYLTRMEKKGLVVKEQGTGNGYRAKIRLTEAGRKATYELRERIKLAVEKGGQGLSDEERDHFYLALQVIAKNLTDISERGL